MNLDEYASTFDVSILKLDDIDNTNKLEILNLGLGTDTKSRNFSSLLHTSDGSAPDGRRVRFLNRFFPR